MLIVSSGFEALCPSFLDLYVWPWPLFILLVPSVSGAKFKFCIGQHSMKSTVLRIYGYAFMQNE